MSNRIVKIENFNHQNIVTLNQQVTEKRYLIFDLWEDTGLHHNQSQSQCQSQSQYKQIFLQINDLKVLSIKEGQIYFDLSNRDDVIESMYTIEEHFFMILKKYLAKLGKKGNFNFCSVIKSSPVNTTTNRPETVALVLNLKNDDYDTTFYNSDKQKMNINTLTKRDSTYNIIIEIMYIYFDMIKGIIVVDTRLRMAIENHIRPIRTQLTDPDSFIQDEKRNKPDISIDDIRQSFDVTNTEVFEDDSNSSTDFQKPPVSQDIQPTQSIIQSTIQSTNFTQSIQSPTKSTQPQIGIKVPQTITIPGDIISKTNELLSALNPVISTTKSTSTSTSNITSDPISLQNQTSITPNQSTTPSPTVVINNANDFYDFTDSNESNESSDIEVLDNSSSIDDEPITINKNDTNNTDDDESEDLIENLNQVFRQHKNTSGTSTLPRFVRHSTSTSKSTSISTSKKPNNVDDTIVLSDNTSDDDSDDIVLNNLFKNHK